MRTPTRKPGRAEARNMQHSLATVTKKGVSASEITAASAGARTQKDENLNSSSAGENKTNSLLDSSSNGVAHNYEVLKNRRKKSVDSNSRCSVELGVSPHFPPSRAVTPAVGQQKQATSDQTIAKTLDADPLSGNQNKSSKRPTALVDTTGNALPSMLETTCAHASTSHTPIKPSPLHQTSSPPPFQPSTSPRRTRSSGAHKTHSKSSSSLSKSLALPPKKVIPNTNSNTTLPVVHSKKKTVSPIQSTTTNGRSSPIPPSPLTPALSPPPSSPQPQLSSGSPRAASPSPALPSPSPVVDTKRDSRASKRTASTRLLSVASKKQKIDSNGGGQNSNSKPTSSVSNSPVRQSQSKGVKPIEKFEFLHPDSLSHKQPKQLSRKKGENENIKKNEAKQPTKNSEGRTIRAQNGGKTDSRAKLSISPADEHDLPSRSSLANTSHANTVAHYLAPLKSSPSEPARAKCNTSFCSSVSSNKSRTALGDIFNTCLNRGGQQRNFNLSGASKPRKRKRNHKPVTSSVCAGSSPTSNSDPNAIPDSMPLDISLYSNVSARSITSTASSRRKYTRACMSMDMSWDKGQSKNQVSCTGSLGKRQVPKKVLASARTKKGPNGLFSSHVGNFEITESDFENAAPEVQPRSRSRSAKGGQKRNGKKNYKGVSPIETGTKKYNKKEMRHKPQRYVLPPEGSKERRAIDSVYDPQVSSDEDTHKAKKRNKSNISKTSKSKPLKNETCKAKEFSTSSILQKPSNATKNKITDRQSKAYTIDFSDQEDTDMEERPRKIVALSPQVRDEPTRRKPQRRACCIKTYCDGSLSDGYMTDTSDLDDDDDDQKGAEPQCNSSMPSETSRLTPSTKSRPMKSLSPLVPQISNFPHLTSAQTPPEPSLPSPLSPSPASLPDTTSSSPAESLHNDLSPCLDLASSPRDHTHTGDTILQGFENVCHQLIACSKNNSFQKISAPPHLEEGGKNVLEKNGANAASEIEVDSSEPQVTLTQFSRVRLTINVINLYLLFVHRI